MVLAPAMTPTAATSPTSRLKPMAVWMTTRAFSLSPAPRYWVITTLVPMLTKLNRVMARSNTWLPTASAATP